MGSVTTSMGGGRKGGQSRFAPLTRFKTDISFEDIAKYPGRACIGRMGAPTKPTFAPATDHVVYLKSSGDSGSLTQKLWKLDLNDGTVSELARPPSGIGEEDTLSEEEKLRRERMRQLHTGITGYQWANKSAGTGTDPVSSSSLICQMGNDIMIIAVSDDSVSAGQPATMNKLVDGSAFPGPILDPRISKDGSVVVFCCERELYSVTVPSTDSQQLPHVRQLTSDAQNRDSVTNGQADFIAMEEMDRYEGYWISPTAQFLVYEQADESHIPVFRIAHSGKSSHVIHPSEAHEDHHYPFAGDANPKVRLFVTKLSSSDNYHSRNSTATLELVLPADDDQQEPYLARVQWMNASKLFVQLLDRRQTKLTVLEFDISNKMFSDSAASEGNDQALTGRVLLKESQPDAWVNLHNILVPIPLDVHDEDKIDGDFDFVWASERTGYQHLYRLNRKGDVVAILTSGNWIVESTSSDMINVADNALYFTGTKDGCLERHLYRTTLDGSDSTVRRISKHEGMHTVVCMDMSKSCYINSWSSLETPFRVAVCSLDDGTVIRDLYDGASEPKLQQLNLRPPEPFSIMAEDGCTTLHGAIYKPDSSVHGKGPYPTIVSTYGGPHVQYVANSWTLTADLRAQRFCSQGYAVIKLDNRGSARRGLEFEKFIHLDMGNVEVQDQAAGVKYWIDQGVVDGSAVGIYGWSYGGYMSAMCLAKRPDVFHAAVAGALVAMWDGYDTCYTERYMGTPKSNPDGYRRSAIMPYVSNIEGSLLIVHGLIDENVHFRHSACLINSLIQAQKHYELLLFPDERHVPRGIADKIFMEQRIASFLERSL